MNATDELHEMLDWFPGGESLVTKAEHFPSSQTPEPYKQLLVHDRHMTITMEKYYKTPVRVRVLARRQEGNSYLRHIVLERCDTGAVVQFGIVRFDFSYVTDAVRDEILAEQTPLGRILINYNVLRHIDLGAIVKIQPGEALQRLFGCPADCVVYGRLATIFCNQKPAVDLLEVAAPVRETTGGT
ncbi:MAG: hypothetical protein NT069_02755 [Planctomycetota bacterium]|nr:hypothetical protein [Planctomycetota bacterium]